MPTLLVRFFFFVPHTQSDLACAEQPRADRERMGGRPAWCQDGREREGDGQTRQAILQQKG